MRLITARSAVQARVGPFITSAQVVRELTTSALRKDGIGIFCEESETEVRLGHLLSESRIWGPEDCADEAARIGAELAK